MTLLSGAGENENGHQEPAFGAESPFEEEVYQSLCDHINRNRISLQHQCGGFRIDMVIKSLTPDKPDIAIECDGASYHSSPEAYAWDMFRQKHLESFGFKFVRIWSRNWWHDAEAETKRLVDFIRKQDDEPFRL